MSWADHVIEPAEVTGSAGPARWPEVLQAFLEWQTPRWPLLAKMRGALADVEQRSVQVGERSQLVQFNPGRTVNSTAKVDAATIEKRRCFLCAENLPPEEKGLAFGPSLVVLANPFPILGRHYVIAHREHRPQEVDVALDGLLAFARAAEGTLSVIYNGPTSGASAPDHLHLQAVDAAVLPEEVHAQRALAAGRLPGIPVFEAPEAKAWFDDRSGRSLVGMVGAPEAVADVARAVIAFLADTEEVGDAGEPPLNLVATAGRPGEVVLLLFPRAAHRPAVYYLEDPDRRVVSPGAIDMAGLVVTVRHEDYTLLRPDDLAQIFHEVSRSIEVSELQAALSRRLSHV